METRAYFQAGGSVPSTSPCYIKRSCDLIAYDALTTHRYVSILGPRQVGKTSLLYKLQAIFERQGIPNAVINLSTLEGAGQAPTQDVASDRDFAARWYTDLAERVAEQIEPGKVPPTAVTGPDAFVGFLSALPAVEPADAHAIIMFDEAATVPYFLRTTFYSQLRDLLNSRPGKAKKRASQIDFAFAGAFHPSVLVPDRDNSPFNVSQEIYIPDFTRAQVDKLLRGFVEIGLALTDGGAQAIWDAAVGHPFLTQKICQDLAYACEEQVTESDVRGVVDTILDHDAHLENLVQRLDESPAEVELIKRVLIRRERVTLSVNQQAAQLEMIGALKSGPDGSARVRNTIYGRLLRSYLSNRAEN